MLKTSKKKIKRCGKRRKSEIFCVRNHRSRTERKKVKRKNKETRARNKRLIMRYPWLQPYFVWTGKKCENDRFDYISLWDEIPTGWINVFGHMMCDEIEEALEEDGLENKVYVEQAKEKYGGLRLYMSGNEKSQHIISIYEAISEHICAVCGRPHTPLLNLSWVSPYCEDCFTKLQRRDKYFYQKPYSTYAPENKELWKIPRTLKWTRYSKDEGEKIIEEDISDRVARIEERWNKLQANRRKNK